MNNKGQITAIISFAILLIVIIFMAPFLMKLVLTPTDKFITALDGVDSSNKSVEATTYIRGVFTGTFDWMILALLTINIIILLITSFLVDVHPAFLIIYIIALFFLFMFAPATISASDRLWNNNPTFTTTEAGVDMTTYMPITRWIFENTGIIIISVAILSGLIMFGKYRFGSSSTGSGGQY